MGHDPESGPPKLHTYRAKRDFARTAEPAGAEDRAAPGWSYVIQKHAARRLHYDLRLELDGVLLSWAVPKGPSLKAGERRLAVRTEDHPLEYADFEGVIPAGEYGGGAVVLWDRGTWRPEGDPRDAMARGRLTFELHGEKLRGRWHLVRTRDQGKAESWLWFKGKDEAASATADIVAEQPDSVVSGRSLEEVDAELDRSWPPMRDDDQATLERRVRALAVTLPQPIALTNLGKILYPELGLTKAALIAYVAVVSAPLLVAVGGRPLTLVRYPNGHTKHGFFQKHARPGLAAAVRRVPITDRAGAVEDAMVVDDLAGLIAVAQLASLELHTWGCHVDQLERPDQLVFDLDPDVGLPWARVVEAALEVRRHLDARGLVSFVKTTGGKGLHVVAPIARRSSWDDAAAFARGVAEDLAAAHPDRYTSHMQKARRRDRIYIDHPRNGRGATAVAAYSPRARPGAPVATPVTWAELEAGVDPLAFTIVTVPARLAAQREDPWAGYAELAQGI